MAKFPKHCLVLPHSPPVFQSHLTLGIILWKNNYINIIWGSFLLLPPLTSSFDPLILAFWSAFDALFFQGPLIQVSFHTLGSNDHNEVDNSRSSILSRYQFPVLGISWREGVHPLTPCTDPAWHNSTTLLLKVPPLSRLLAGLEIYTGKMTYFVIVQNCFTSLSCCTNSAQCRKKEFPETSAGAEPLQDGWNSRYQTCTHSSCFYPQREFGNLRDISVNITLRTYHWVFMLPT